MLSEHRSAFRAANSVWEAAMKAMQQDGVADHGLPHMHSIEYLTFEQLGQLVLILKDEVFPCLNDKVAKERRKEPRFRCALATVADRIDNWRADVAKIRRLRNQVAHLRGRGVSGHGGPGRKHWSACERTSFFTVESLERTLWPRRARNSNSETITDWSSTVV